MAAELPTADQLGRILYYASLAPSPHNVQPWKFAIDGSRLDILLAPEHRIMRELDPQERERDIALGAVIENVVLAAVMDGLLPVVQYLPKGASSGVAASVQLKAEAVALTGVAHSSGGKLQQLSHHDVRGLGQWMMRRAVNRSRYTRRPVPPEQLAELKAIACDAGMTLHVITDRVAIRQFADLAGMAGRFKFSHEPTHRELYHYLRFSRSHAAQTRDGLPLEHFNIPRWMERLAPIGMHWAAVKRLNRLGYHRALAWMQESWLINSAPAVCMLTVSAGGRESYLRGGRALQQLWLAAAKYGLAVQPHSATADLTYARAAGFDDSIAPAWQERLDSLPDELSQLFGVQGDLHIVNLFRVGYPTREWPTRSQRRTVAVQQNSSGNDKADEFYRTLTERNVPFIGATEQAVLRHSQIGVAGCGSIGGASLEVLVRMGSESLLLAEPDTFELNNLNRQNATLADIGVHKAAGILERLRAINPNVRATLLERGLTADNLPYFVASSSVVIDGVDVTTPSAIKIKVMLHHEAYRQQKAVICGYDIAGTQLLRIYDYHNGKRKPLNGKFDNVDLDTLTSLGFLSKVVSPLDLPAEMLPVTRQMIAGTLSSIPQLGPTACQFGVLSAWAALDVLSGRPLRHKVLIDIPHELRPASVRWRMAVGRIIGIIRLKWFLTTTMRKSSRASSLEAGADGV